MLDILIITPGFLKEVYIIGFLPDKFINLVFCEIRSVLKFGWLPALQDVLDWLILWFRSNGSYFSHNCYNVMVLPSRMFGSLANERPKANKRPKASEGPKANESRKGFDSPKASERPEAFDRPKAFELEDSTAPKGLNGYDYPSSVRTRWVEQPKNFGFNSKTQAFNGYHIQKAPEWLIVTKWSRAFHDHLKTRT
ncbi:hypothetical protein ROZALSC1DRAFT_25349 [Rozella allomycis CSF55]|uniref:Uncharacterized protein n=1 Tax=Rozella allomycis (strain CSF55) TaxID=988480 RepID=A0A4P9YAX1_ROZAC|nr:hypothetical protein ROZALSC1DRAFT_25349 [Rozella allomycis CSF55]